MIERHMIAYAILLALLLAAIVLWRRSRRARRAPQRHLRIDLTADHPGDAPAVPKP